jgi:hypothetical protein
MARCNSAPLLVVLVDVVDVVVEVGIVVLGRCLRPVSETRWSRSPSQDPYWLQR